MTRQYCQNITLADFFLKITPFSLKNPKNRFEKGLLHDLETSDKFLRSEILLKLYGLKNSVPL